MDEYLATSAGNRAAFMSQLQAGFDSTMHIAMQVAQLHPGMAIAIAAVQVANGGTLSAATLLSVVPGGSGLGTLGRAFGSYSSGKRLMRGARAYGDDVLELHHVVPQFMLGWRSKGRVVAMTGRQHDEYHRILDRVLKERGMPTRNQGQEAWKYWLARNPDGGHEARAALLESVDRFKEATNGTIDLMGDLWIEMSRQGWMLR